VSVAGLLALGLFLGLRHALDPDHVVAVAAITAHRDRPRRALWRAAWLGASWGLGHSLTLFLVGGAILLFDLTIPPRLGLSLELAVALALVAVGLVNLFHPPHAHAAPSPLRDGRRAFGVGLVHGLAGSAAIALLVLATVPNAILGLLYLATFAFGTLAGMALLTTGFAAPLVAAMGRWPSLGRGARLATGALSVGLGVWLIVQIGFVDGLFLGRSDWSPH
jgi:high-affinity nickel-transport protein